MRDHLRDTDTYARLYPMQANMYKADLLAKLKDWNDKHKKAIGRSTKRCLTDYLDKNIQPFGTLYGTIKAHKNLPPDGLPKSRPIVNTRGSLAYAHACLLDNYLQPIAQSRSSFIKNSFALKQHIQSLQLPAQQRVMLFTADAESMYTNIPTNKAISNISSYLKRRSTRQRFPDIPVDAATELLDLIFRNNFFTFGDLTFKQKKGIAMGTPPAVAVATLFMADYEEPIVEIFTQNNGRLLAYKRFIDDMFGIWLVHPDPGHNLYLWNRFKERMNLQSGLTWNFSELSPSVVFLDMVISIDKGKIHTTLYEKELNLHLYIPPFSAHPPGLLPGVVFGNLFRIYTLCSDPKDQLLRTKEFYSRLIRRGYKRSQILPLFNKAIKRAQTYTGPMPNHALRKLIVLHLTYHPDDPSSRLIQRYWRQFVSEPPNEIPLRDVVGGKYGHPSGIERMVIAYKRPMNLGNYLSHKDLTKHNEGPAASTYL